MKKNMGKLEVQEVNTRMRAVCSSCGELPEDRRFIQTKGSGRWQKQTIHCVPCGSVALTELHAHLSELEEELEA